MRYTKDQNSIIKFFERESNTPKSYNEIVTALSTTKAHKATIKAAISSLMEMTILVKDKKRFRMKDFTPPTVNKSGDSMRSTDTRRIPPTLVEGKFDATPLSRNLSFAFVRTPDGDFFVSSEDTLNAYHNDRVAIEPFYKQGKADYCKVMRIIERANSRMAGEISTTSAGTLFVCSSPKIHNWFTVIDIANAEPGKKVIFEVSNWGNTRSGIAPAGSVVEVLGDSGDPQVELLAVIAQHQLPLSFPPEVLAALDGIDEEISKEIIEKRTDLRDLFTFTIDPSSAKDYDDAISIQSTSKGWKLWVHIADVAHYLAPDNPIFIEAAKRGNSFYFPKKVIPMLPEKLSNGVCSLRPNEDKLVMTVVTEFDEKGSVVSQNLIEAVIRSDYRLSYEDVDKLFDGDETDLDENLKIALSESRALSKLLTKKRMRDGYIFFDLPEIEYHYDDEGFLHKFTLAEETESHKLIENFMLIANEYTAMKLSIAAPTSLYRIHEDPDQNKLEKLFETLSAYGIRPVRHENLNKTLQALLYSLPTNDFHVVFDRIILRSMKKAKYSTQHIRHFGLSMENYTHFTSPIRRLCDLVIHHLCKSYILKSQDMTFTTDQMKRFAELSSEQELLANEAEREIERIYKLAYLRDRIGEKYSGMVIGTTSSGLLVRLNEIPIVAALKNSQFESKGFTYFDREMRHVNKRTGYYYQLLDKVKVQIMDVSDDVYLEFTDDDDHHKHVVEREQASLPREGKHKADKSSSSASLKGIDSKATYKKGGTKQKHKSRR